MLVKLIFVVAILASSVLGRNTEKEENKRRKKDRKPGKTISLEENGDIDITIRSAKMFKNIFKIIYTQPKKIFE